jgi:hypothetical protein
MVGSFRDGDAGYHVSVAVVRAQGFSGNVEAGRTILTNLLFVNGKAYLNGPDVGAALGADSARIASGRTVLFKAPGFNSNIVRLSEPGAFTDAFLTGRTSLKKAGTSTLNGHKAVKLSDKSGDIYIATDGVSLPLRVDTTGATSTSARYQNVLIDYSDFDKEVTLAPPADVLDFDDDTTMPERYQDVHFDFDTCNSTGCGVKVTAKNVAGNYAANPGPLATFKLTRDSNKSDLGSCQVAIPLVANNQQTVVGCRITSQAWKSFAAGGGNYTGEVQISNPLYDQGSGA